jgi:hypothetical protein
MGITNPDHFVGVGVLASSLIQDKVDGQRSGQIIYVARAGLHEAEHPGRGRWGEVPGWGSESGANGLRPD